MKLPTQQMIAKLSGVSQGHVSQVLRGSNQKHVASATRQRILQVAREIGYLREPHPSVAQRIAERTDTVAFVVVGYARAEFVRHVFFQELLVGIHQQVQARGKYLLFSCVERMKDLDLAGLLARVDGLLVKWNAASPDLLEEMARKKPTVLVQCAAPGANVSEVSKDVKHGKFNLTNYLLDQGHRHIAYLLRSAELNSVGQLDYQGYTEAMAARGLAPPPTYQSLPSLQAFYSEHGGDGSKLWDLILALEPRPTALVCFNDYLALELLNATKARGIQIPDQFSVTGDDDVPQAEMAPPALTTLRSPWEEIGSKAMHLLSHEIENPRSPRRIIRLLPQLKERASVARIEGAG